MKLTESISAPAPATSRPVTVGRPLVVCEGVVQDRLNRWGTRRVAATHSGRVLLMCPRPAPRRLCRDCLATTRTQRGPRELALGPHGRQGGPRQPEGAL